MPVSPGTRLGPYDILSALGAGGMGEVYKARDTRLDRIVAIKVLPASLAGDPEFKARFEREAKSISALNHPNICTLHDVGDGAVPYLVMELLEGETLAGRLMKGPIPADQALDYALQIADALDKAHRQGIVHRDLKPANVFLVKTAGTSGPGTCKLLDFGLAKLGAAPPPGTIETRLLTTPPLGGAQGGPTTPLTAQGSILGTFQYMAPEQIEGQDVDARTDIWAFGCVLYEMLTGKRAFEGKSQASLIASILERQPTPMAELQPMTPPALGRLVRTCLEKSPENRFHTAHDLWLHLLWIDEGGSSAGLPAPMVAGRKRRERAVLAGVAVGLAALSATGAWILKPAPVVTPTVARFTYALPTEQEFTRTGRQFVAMSPDGTKIAYIAENQIYLRHVNELEAQPIRGSNVDPADIVFSPDGASIAFFTPPSPGAPLEKAVLKKIAIVGGAPVPLGPIGAPYGMRWQGDRIVFSLGRSIQSISEAGGEAETLVSVTPESGEWLSQPQFLNDGRDLLYTVRPRGASFNDGQIVVQARGSAERRVLVTGGTGGSVAASGHLLYARDTTLFAQVFDEGSLQVRGGPVPVVEGVRQTLTTGVGQFGVSKGGNLAYVPGAMGGNNDVVWVDRTGGEEALGMPPYEYIYPRLSPDGSKIAVNTRDGEQDIWLWDIARRAPRRLTSGPAEEVYFAWMPDSQSVIYRSNSEGHPDIYKRAADGTGSVQRLTDTSEAESPYGVLADSQSVLVRMTTGPGPLNLVSLDGTGTLRPVMKLMTEPVTNAEVSPDGRWIAYQSTEGSTTDEIHVRPFPDTDAGYWPISIGGGQKPFWSRSGNELFYVVRNPSRLMTVPVSPTRPGAAFSYGTPTVLLDVSNYQSGVFGRPFDVSLDDKRFLMVKPTNTDDRNPPTVVIVTNWFEELRARAKAK